LTEVERNGAYVHESQVARDLVRMKSKRNKRLPESDKRLKELEEENALLRSKLAKQEKVDDKPGSSWIEDAISRGLAFLRKDFPGFEDKGALKHFVRVALCIVLLSSEEANERRDEIRSFSLIELKKMSDWWMDDEMRKIHELMAITR
jgi:hypothetical protein